ncbi:leucine/isoleucine/valine transporter permease subunit [Variibacter gotjawalensis]|uniref:Leucine/isoleucine/valine transporter permease subunit n=1 Tax=Variibacter gotjawalensis TaxID=1333996 RepID=A0A0S3Q068_9BRAD|nr:branched-chain amino acid ABC transporter permease [Variibacter gotjawalensis]NIK47379.1 branched-chain amino acid transport system permease protein [Variibacter gotjawalensis]RZS49275.1 amino acid/amide ABC transporter membrane protein 2 (HAAT family) [Variibacter gotjawalensis]BAT61539.1 leucine/isoleucine/valine transporter permease subunit [Variibacter gotjawalensis]
MSKAMMDRAALVVLFAGLIAAPLVLTAFGAPFWINIIAEIMIWSLLAASANLLFGYVGLLSFGQALYFGFGMYGVALSITHWGAGFWTALVIGILAAVAMAAVAGALAVRLTWHYFAIITVVFSLIFYFLAMSSKSITGGDDGLSFSAPPVLSFGKTSLTLADPVTQYYVIFFVAALCYLIKALIVRSPLGLAFEAVRENDRRASLIGINVYFTRWIAFVIAGALAGAGGALFALFGRYASASYMVYHVSGEAVVWAIVGGAGTLLGPLVGAAVLILFRELISGLWENYLLAVGAIVILVVIFAPQGLMGAWHRIGRKPDAQGDDAPAEAYAEPPR